MRGHNICFPWEIRKMIYELYSIPPFIWSSVTVLLFSTVVGWLVWAKRPFETVFQSISGRLPERGRKKREVIDERKNVQTTPTRTY